MRKPAFCICENKDVDQLQSNSAADQRLCFRYIGASDSRARGRRFNPHSGRRVVSLSKIHLPPKSTGYTQEAVAQSRHDLKKLFTGMLGKKRNQTKSLHR